MSDILIDDQVAPSAPSASKAIIYNDSVSKVLVARTSVKPQTIGSVRNGSTAAQAFLAADLYVTGSSLAVPSHLLQVGTIMRWKLGLTKTAGTAGQVVTVRVGTAGTIADTARLTFTQVASGTSVADTAVIEVECLVRSIGASGVVTGILTMKHVLAATGFSTLDHNVMSVTSAGFDTTVAGTIVGLSYNHSTAGAGNIEFVTAELIG